MSKYDDYESDWIIAVANTAAVAESSVHTLNSAIITSHIRRFSCVR